MAAEGFDLILVARRQERQERLAEELRRLHSVAVEVLPADLSQPADVQRVTERIAQVKRLSVLVNNAGFGISGRFDETDIAKQFSMIRVHVIAAVTLVWAALPGMIARHHGAIINVSSIGAFLTRSIRRGDASAGTLAAGNVTYSATKAYLVVFSEALQAELEGTGVRVQALCPGFTHTGFHDTDEYRDFDRSVIPKALWMSADEVVRISLRALEGRRIVCIPGVRNRLLVALAGNWLASRVLSASLARRLNQSRRKLLATLSPDRAS